MGNVQGIPICFDAKETRKASLPIANIHEHQIRFMEQFAKQGGLAFILVNFTELDRFFLLGFEWCRNIGMRRKTERVNPFR
jgi:recombination protein U